MPDPIELLRASLGDRYMPERELGHGAMATVYLAEDRKHHRKVALKVLEPRLLSRVASSRFLREIEIAANLTHPRILPVFDSGQVDGLLYYVMPYVEGESLRERLDREGRLPLEDALRIAQEVAEALSYAHAHGVVHRDIKPENIMLTDGGAVVADFGIARATSAAGTTLTATGLSIGTPAYMSPEQAVADAEPDQRSDIYSLGCVLYEMLAGVAPFTARTAQAVMVRHLSSAPPSLRTSRSDAPPGAEEIVQRALAKEPGDRFANARELSDALDGVLRPKTRGAATGEETGRKSRSLWAGAAALTTAIVLGVVLLVTLSGEPTDAERTAGSVAEGADVIAILPFDASGPGIEGFGDGIVSLLSANLDGVGGIHTVSPRSVFSAWREEGGGLDFQEAMQLGRDLGAGSVLLGSLVAVGSDVRLTAELYGVEAAGRLAQAQIRGPADSVLALVDTLSVHLLRDVWRSREPIPDVHLSAVLSGSIAAIRHYLRGEHHFRRTAWDSAAADFERAVEEDSTFALAQWRLSEARAWTTFLGSEAEMGPLRAAYRHRDRLPAQERTLVVARAMDGEGDIAGLDSMHAYVERHPHDAEGWLMLADLMVHAMPVDPRPWEEILETFDRALELRPSMNRALIHPLHITALAGDRVAYHDYLARLESPDTEVERFAVWEQILWGDDGQADSLLARVLARAPVSMNNPFIDALIRNRALPPVRVARAFDAAAGRVPAGLERITLEVQRVRSLTALGRLQETGEPLERIWDVDPDRAARLAIETSIALGVPSPLLERAEARLAEAGAGAPMAALWRAWLELHRGEVRAATAFAARAREWSRGDSVPHVEPLLRATSGWLALARGDTVGSLDVMTEALREAGYAAPSGALWYELERAMVRTPTAREEAIHRLRHARSGVLYTPGRFALLGIALEATGRPAEADEAYRRAARLLSTADDAVRDTFGLEAYRPSAADGGA